MVVKCNVILQPIKKTFYFVDVEKLGFTVFGLTRVVSSFLEVNLEPLSRRSFHRVLTFCVFTKVRKTERRSVEDGG